MRTRNRPYPRFVVWLAFVAMGLASLMPVVSQLAMTHLSAAEGTLRMGVMAGMAPDCPGHMAHAAMPAAPAHPDQHGAAAPDACGYCSFLAHCAGMPPLPVMAMRPPRPAAEAPLAPLATGARIAPWRLDAAPRGPPTAA